MSSVVFDAPFFLDTTLRFVEAVADLPGVRTGLISQDPAERLPQGLKSKLALTCKPRARRTKRRAPPSSIPSCCDLLDPRHG